MICRLCLQNSTDLINIFDEFGEELSIALILAKYFWFEPKRDDPISTAICSPCWVSVSSFHAFYTSIEEAHKLLTERFSIKTELQKNGKQQFFGVDDHESMETIISKPQPEDVVTFPAPVKCEQNNKGMEDSVDDDLETHDGERIMDSDFLADSEEDEIDATDVLELNVVPVEDENKRTTRSKAKTAATATLTKKLKSNAKATPKTDGTAKRRRGRPRKDASVVGTSKKAKKSKLGEDDEDSNTQSYKEKMREVDEKIAKHIRLCCDICGEGCDTFADVRSHMKQRHHVRPYALCCNKKFYKRALLVYHLEKHINPDCYRCDECDKTFADKQCMRNHILLKHQPDEVKTFQCQQCAKRFAKPYLLEQHRIVHASRTHICNICERGFPSPSHLSAHKKLQHMNYGTMCDICAKVIRGRAAFAKHQLEHAGVVLPKVQCDKCGSWHKNKYSLQKHKRRHNDDGTVHVCKICGKVAPNRSALLGHQRNVHGEARFECSVCKKCFKKPINLREHMAIHTGEVLYKCPHCTKTFNSHANMHSHRKKVHPKEFEETRRIRLENSSKADAPKVSTIKAAETIQQTVRVKNENDDKLHIEALDKDDYNTTDSSIMFPQN